MRVGQRLRADLDPDQFDQFGIGMDHALDAVGDGGSVRREEAGIEAPDAAGRGDRARDQEQAGRIGQQAGIGKRLPGAFEFWRRAVDLAAEAEPGFLAGLADRGDRQRARARRRDLRAALEQIGFELLGDRAATGTRLSDLSTRPPGNTYLPGMNTTLSWRLPTSTFGFAAVRSTRISVAASFGRK